MNYPNGMNKTYSNIINYGNRGMDLEEDLNISNEYYRETDIAIIYKKPTPITINHVDYPNRKDAVITKAKFKIPSTTDYNGIYKGKYIDFEAKETANKTSFPLANIHEHQIEHLRRIVKHGGIGFIIVYFSSLNRLFLLMAEDLFDYIDNNDRKSIPLSYFEEKAKEMKVTLRPRIDYLKYIEF
jgi:recombination protein U